MKTSFCSLSFLEYKPIVNVNITSTCAGDNVVVPL